MAPSLTLAFGSTRMRFVRHTHFDDLPKPDFTGEEYKDDARVKEFDAAFDQVATAIGTYYLVDTEGGVGIKGAPISMYRYVSICRQHTIVVGRQAWHPDIVRALLEQVQKLPQGWMLAVDASDFSSGQAHIVVTSDGTIHGWSEFSARNTLCMFGFDRIRGPVQNLRFALSSILDNLKLEIAARKVARTP